MVNWRNLIDVGTTWGGRPKARARRECFERYGDTCWVCGHGGAREVDHLDERARGGASYDLANLRPAHGSYSPCPVCVSTTTGRARCCNQERNRKPRTSPIVVDLGTL